MADSSTSSTSSISQGTSKTRKPSHFRAKIKVQNIQIVLRNLHQNTIKLSVKNLNRKQSNNTQQKMAARNQTKDLKCATHLLSDKFRNMTEEKKAIVRDLGFGGLMHIPPLRVDHQLLRELANQTWGEQTEDRIWFFPNNTKKNRSCTWHQCNRRSIS
ncbi:uncharacterized protein LOC127744760 [Arachis duranensis]|uniref:Uncharacterized protein LOC127744760 n=1 Tax=Arachis duranensis TaxID=130453 RepID=A0A9C6WSL7_ARADU|nr:uncharacterized protein LOC127744760 [Arachis duranensis]